MVLARVLPTGELPVPAQISEKLQLEPGTVVQMYVTDPDCFEAKLLPSPTFEQMRVFLSSFEPTGLDIDEAIALGEADAADIAVAELARQQSEYEQHKVERERRG